MNKGHGDTCLKCLKGGNEPNCLYPKMWDFFISNFHIKSVLDIGCATGLALNFFKDRCADVLGLETCQEAIDASDQSISSKIVHHDFDRAMFLPETTFDMIWCSDVLNYVTDHEVDIIFESMRLTNAKYLLISLSPEIGIAGNSKKTSSYWISRLYKYGYELSPKATRMARAIAYLEHNADSQFSKTGMVFVKRQKPEGKEAIITWAAGKEFCKSDTFKVFINSIGMIDFWGDKLVFTHDMDVETREYLYERQFKVIDVDPSRVEVIIRDRFLAWYNFLCDHDYKRILLVDAKDVVFQRNPFDFLTDDKLYFISEGKSHKDCNWNTKDQLGFQETLGRFQENFADWDVICGGTIFGCSDLVKRLIINIWSTTLQANNRCSDQAALNYLYHTVYCKDSKSCIVDPRFCPLVATANLPESPRPICNNGILYHSKLDTPYFIWHQWDRVSKYKQEVLEKYL